MKESKMRVARIASTTLAMTFAAWAAHAQPLMMGAEGLEGEDHTFAFVWAQESFERSVVKGQPYAAEAVTEIVQTLADGNRIVRKTTARVARDSEGRTRREHALGAVGPLVAAGKAPRTVFVNDPVAGVAYVLDLDGRTAFRHRPAKVGMEHGHGKHADEFGIALAPGPGVTHGRHAPHGGLALKTFERHLLPKGAPETLGKQLIEGVEAEGTRTTVTVPAGEIGNERPIQIVSERWFSPELQAVVSSRHSDPRFGETTYRLTHLSRGDPAASLFEVPADFRVEEGPGPRERRREVIRERRERK
jgi:hypothetical protein